MARGTRSGFLDYRIPEKVRGQVRPGVMVMVPFQNRQLPGIVMTVSDVASVPHAPTIHRVVGDGPVISDTLLRLARWMARQTLAPLREVIPLMLPPGMRSETYVELTPLTETVPPNLPKPSRELLELLIARGPLTDTQIEHALKGIDWEQARVPLRRRGLVEMQRMLRVDRVQTKTRRMVRLQADPSAWDADLSGLKRVGLYRAILDFLHKEEQPVEAAVVRAETGAKTYHLDMLNKRALITYSHREVIRDPLSGMIFTPDEPPTLTPEQDAVWAEIRKMLNGSTGARMRPILLLGVTGSGKTELYMRAAEAVLRAGKQALILVPEISLTPQTARRFAVRFPDQVGLWHSGLSEGERYDTWRRVRDGDLAIVIGARSALFAPFPDLGLIVMDEEEDTSYKANRAPAYHAREVAEQLAHQTGAMMMMGSATPSLEAYHRAQEGRYRLLRLPSRVMGHRKRVIDWQRFLHLAKHRYQPVPGIEDAYTIPLPPVQIVDMRAELKAGNRTIFSRALQDAVDRALAQETQVLLFLNRRGTATYVFCRDCGWVAHCPHCDIPLTYHKGLNALVCHRCNARRPYATTCPHCGSQRVRAFGLGTEGLESRVVARWPEAQIMRWDQDVARSHAAHTAIMRAFVRGETDILVGTQMIARGLDVPKVTVVGVISADTALNLPDFRATEWTFQLLAQVAGRAGRGLLDGKAFIQTYHPDHYAIRYAADHDYEGFAAQELAFRRRTGYPPAIRLARLVYSHPDSGKAQAAAEHLASLLRHALGRDGLPATDLIGPAPAYFARVRGRTRWQLLLRSVDPAAFLRKVELPRHWQVDVDPVSVL